VPDLSPLRGLRDLRSLELYDVTNPTLAGLDGCRLERLVVYPQVTDLTALAGMTSLRELRVYGPVDDLAPLRDLVHLERLELHGAAVTQLSALSNLRALRHVSLATSAVEEVCALRHVPLTFLNLTNTPVADVAALDFSRIQTLRLGNTRVRTLPAMGGELQELVLDGTGVSSLEGLADCPLATLRLRGTRVDDLTPLSGIGTLRHLDLQGCPVSDLGPVAASELIELDLRGTRVSELDGLNLCESALVWTDAGPEALERLRARYPNAHLHGTWKVSAPDPGVRVVLVSAEREVPIDPLLVRLLLYRLRFDGHAVPDLSRWHERLLRRSGESEPPDAEDAAYWSRLLRLSVADRQPDVVAGYKLTQPGRWQLHGDAPTRMAAMIRAQLGADDGATADEEAWLEVLADWLEDAGAVEARVYRVQLGA
jgi:hypothetical protein